MSPSGTWKRRAAHGLTRHAARTLRATRPGWSDALESEVEHIPDDRQALIWAVGCVRASYAERYYSRHVGLLAAAVIGIAYALGDETVTGVLAAQPWPRWYIPFAKAHRHLGLELWWILTMTVPCALLAAGLGILLKRLARGASMGLPLLSLAVWNACSLATDWYSIVVTCHCPLSTLWEPWTLFPASSAAGIIMPAAALLLAFHFTARPRT